MKKKISTGLGRRTKIILGAMIALWVVVICVCAYADEIDAAIASHKLGNPQEHDSYAGVLSIPCIGVELPCIEAGADKEELAALAVDATACGAKIWYGKGVITEGVERGNWLICDHDWQGFSAIMECRIDDVAYFTDSQGNEYLFLVKDMFEGFINEERLPVDKDGEIFFDYDPSHLILMTCYPEADVTADRDDRRFFVYLEMGE